MKNIHNSKTLTISVVLLVCTTLLFFFSNHAKAAQQPIKNKGNKWRIGYLEGGSYINYPINLVELANGLMEIGWIEPAEIPYKKYSRNSFEIWKWLSHNAKSEYIEFVENAFWSGDFKNDLRIKNKSDLLERLNHKQDIDFMIAMGTWAGQDLANNNHSVPTMVMSSSNPIQSGVIKSVTNSGFDHIHAKVDPDRYFKQVLLFHNIIDFSRLGVVYENSLEGKTYSAIEDIEKAAKERNFEVVKCSATLSQVEREVAAEGVIDCYNKLAPQVDAMYITVNQGTYPKVMPEILEPLTKYKIPSFSQRGPAEVHYGVLLSIARADFKEVGRWHADILTKILHGAKPGTLNQFFEDPNKIVLNLKAAQLIDYDPPFDVLGAADEIYNEIQMRK